MLEKFLARDRIREGQERTRVTSESIVTIRERVGKARPWVAAVGMERGGRWRFI